RERVCGGLSRTAESNDARDGESRWAEVEESASRDGEHAACVGGRGSPRGKRDDVACDDGLCDTVHRTVRNGGGNHRCVFWTGECRRCFPARGCARNFGSAGYDGGGAFHGDSSRDFLQPVFGKYPRSGAAARYVCAGGGSAD